MNNAKTIIEIVIKQAWNLGDLSVLDEYIAKDYKRSTPTGLVIGIEGFKAHITNTRAQYPSFSCKIKQIIQEQNQGVIVWQSRVKLATTNDRITWQGMTWFSIRLGKLVEEWELYDKNALADAMDLFPKD